MKKQVHFAKILALLSIPLVAFILWYIFLPAFNLHSFGFWIYLLVNLIYIVTILITFNKKYYKLYMIPAILMALFIVLKIFSATIFHSTRYANLIEKENSSFEEDIKEASFEQVPTVDRDTAQRLGSRKMGEMLELVSQYNVSDAYTQINFDDKSVRVTPLEYNGFLKWISNRNKGIPNYCICQPKTVPYFNRKLGLNCNIKCNTFEKIILIHLLPLVKGRVEIFECIRENTTQP